ncbi:MAG: sialidase family protein [Clostridia bacterium]
MAKKELPSGTDLIEAGYPYGKAAEGIPLGNPDAEWARSNPDIVLYMPGGQGAYVNDNEHFIVFPEPFGEGLLAVWTQSSCEAHGDNHLVLARSGDGVSWGAPEYITGAAPDGSGKQASWGFPVVSRKGRIYLFYTKELDLFDNNRQGSGAMGCIYSDDSGCNWVDGAEIQMPVSRYDNPDPGVPKNWIVWQPPVRDSQGRFIAGYTLVTSKALKPQPDMWVNADSHSYFMRFENIDDNPAPGDIRITWLPKGDMGLGVPNSKHPDISTCQEPSVVLLPDGRLFAVMRTMTGYVYYSVSDDDGLTWRTPDRLRYRDDGEGIMHPLSPCPVYRMDNGLYFILFHNNPGICGGFSQFKDSWEMNEANFLRNPTYISIGEYREGAAQPIWFGSPYRLFDTDGIAVGPKQTSEIATYTSYLEWKGKRILWYPDRKFYLLGKYMTDGLLEKIHGKNIV